MRTGSPEPGRHTPAVPGHALVRRLASSRTPRVLATLPAVCRRSRSPEGGRSRSLQTPLSLGRASPGWAAQGAERHGGDAEAAALANRTLGELDSAQQRGRPALSVVHQLSENVPEADPGATLSRDTRCLLTGDRCHLLPAHWGQVPCCVNTRSRLPVSVSGTRTGGWVPPSCSRTWSLTEDTASHPVTANCNFPVSTFGPEALKRDPHNNTVNLATRNRASFAPASTGQQGRAWPLPGAPTTTGTDGQAPGRPGGRHTPPTPSNRKASENWI